MSSSLLLGVIALLFFGVAHAGDKEQVIDWVKAYLLNEEYPELFAEQSYRIKVNELIVDDLDRDGRPEVILHMTPHYRQSPTIVIFTIAKSNQVVRVREGLAPGPLVELTGNFLDSHELDSNIGAGVDISVADKDGRRVDEDKRRVLIEKSLEEFGAVVEYRDFFHLDSREGRGVYIDMRHTEVPDESNNCEKFEFSAVDKVFVSERKGDKAKYILAAVGDKLYAYRIAAITKDGFLDKTLHIMDMKDHD